jgi:hypothetical protein
MFGSLNKVYTFLISLELIITYLSGGLSGKIFNPNLLARLESHNSPSICKICYFNNTTNKSTVACRQNSSIFSLRSQIYFHFSLE